MDGHDTAPPDWRNSLLTARTLPPWAVALAWFIVLLAYLYQGVIPAFNADDIIEIQYPGDALTILSAGRWGFYVVYAVLFNTNPAPLLATVLGTTCIVASALLAARLLAFRLAISAFAFIVVGSVSVYYGDLFDYDSTRVAFPLGNLLAIAGLHQFIRGRRAIGVGLMALAPSCYPAASELAAAVLVALAIRRCMARPAGAALPECLAAAAGLAGSLALYVVVTRAGYWALDLPLTERTRLDPLAAVHRFREIVGLFRVHSVPLLARRPAWYLPAPVAIGVTALWAGFVVHSVAVAQRVGGPVSAASAAALNGLLLLTPYCLIFASGGANTVFEPRTLYAFATIHGFCGAILLDAAVPLALRSPARRAATLVVAAALAIIVAGNAMRITESAFDAYLASQSDLFATNRIISRIDEVLAETSGGPPANGDIPIAVIYARPTLAGPRGSIGTSRQTPWSREWIFRLIDRRFSWVLGDRYQDALLAAQSHGEWPARDSVFVHDGTVVVVVNK